jgi:hypothetical protein
MRSAVVNEDDSMLELYTVKHLTVACTLGIIRP